MQTSTQTNETIMRVLPIEKLRVNLFEYRFLEQAVSDTAIGSKEDAIQAIVCYAKLHLGMCLKDEASALIYKLHTTPVGPRLSSATSY